MTGARPPFDPAAPTDPRTVECPACHARAGMPCTVPTDTGRRDVAWFHVYRQDLERVQIDPARAERLVAEALEAVRVSQINRHARRIAREVLEDDTLIRTGAGAEDLIAEAVRRALALTSEDLAR